MTNETSTPGAQWGVLILIAIMIIWFARWILRDPAMRSSESICVGDATQCFRVQAAYAKDGGRLAARRLQEVDKRIKKLISYMRTRPQNGRTKILRKIESRYDSNSLVEVPPDNPENDTAYAVGKGDVIGLCLRERNPRESGELDHHDLVPLNTLMFVALHELTHLGCDAEGASGDDHPPAFWKAFKIILKDAEKADTIFLIDYAKNPARYCGVTINYSPAFNTEVVRHVKT